MILLESVAQKLRSSAIYEYWYKVCSL